MNRETIFLVAFFKFSSRGPEYGTERMDLQHIYKTEEDARNHLFFCDEAGWYEGALIEERAVGINDWFRGKRIWLIQLEDGSMKEAREHPWYNNVVNLIG